MSPETRIQRSFPLRLAKSLRERADSFARLDGVSLNHFITIALAEKVSRLEYQAVSIDVPANHNQFIRPK
jgi:predicted HicB family RNase H-like nuclease